MGISLLLLNVQHGQITTDCISNRENSSIKTKQNKNDHYKRSLKKIFKQNTQRINHAIFIGHQKKKSETLMSNGRRTRCVVVVVILCFYESQNSVPLWQYIYIYDDKTITNTQFKLHQQLNANNVTCFVYTIVIILLLLLLFIIYP